VRARPAMLCIHISRCLNAIACQNLSEVCRDTYPPRKSMMCISAWLSFNVQELIKASSV